MTRKITGTQKPAGLSKPSSPQSQTCAKCGAVFHWQPSDPQNKASPLVANLAKFGDKCDCGYGTGAPVFEE